MNQASKIITHRQETEDLIVFHLTEENANGFIRCYIFQEELTTMYMDFLAVNKDKRKQGLGASLIQKCEELAKKENCTHIGMYVDKAKWLVKWYSELGYKFIEDIDDTYIAMRKEF